MKTKLLIAGFAIATFTFISCEKCAECHYDGLAGEVELGEYCGDELEEAELNGFNDADNDTTYEIHCHEH